MVVDQSRNSCDEAARSAWTSRWWAMLGVAQQSALAATLAEGALGELDGFLGEAPPLADVAIPSPLGMGG